MFVCWCWQMDVFLGKLGVVSSGEDEEDDGVWTAELKASAACYHDVLPLHFVWDTCRSCWASWRVLRCAATPRRLHFPQLSCLQPHNPFDHFSLTLGNSDDSTRMDRELKGCWRGRRGSGWCSWPVKRSHEEVQVFTVRWAQGEFRSCRAADWYLRQTATSHISYMCHTEMCLYC